MNMNLNEIIENKIKYEMGQLYNYLNEIKHPYLTAVNWTKLS